MAVTVQLNRPYPQIPVGDVIEEILQHVLFHRRQVPSLVSAIVNDFDYTERFQSDLVRIACNNGNKVERFCTGFVAARNGVRQVFQLRAGISLRRAAIVIGSSPSSPVDLYLIEFQPCSPPNSDENDDGSASLTSVERRKVIRQLIDQGVCYRRGDCDFKEISRATKTFLFVEANRGLVSENLQPRPDLDFMRYCVSDHTKAKRQRLGVHWIVLKIIGNSGCVGSDAADAFSMSVLDISVGLPGGEQEKDAIWYQFQEPIHGFDE